MIMKFKVILKVIATTNDKSNVNHNHNIQFKQNDPAQQPATVRFIIVL